LIEKKKVFSKKSQRIHVLAADQKPNPPLEHFFLFCAFFETVYSEELEQKQWVFLKISSKFEVV